MNRRTVSGRTPRGAGASHTIELRIACGSPRIGARTSPPINATPRRAVHARSRAPISSSSGSVSRFSGHRTASGTAPFDRSRRNAASVYAATRSRCSSWRSGAQRCSRGMFPARGRTAGSFRPPSLAGAARGRAERPGPPARATQLRARPPVGAARAPRPGAGSRTRSTGSPRRGAPRRGARHPRRRAAPPRARWPACGLAIPAADAMRDWRLSTPANNAAAARALAPAGHRRIACTARVELAGPGLQTRSVHTVWTTTSSCRGRGSASQAPARCGGAVVEPPHVPVQALQAPRIGEDEPLLGVRERVGSADERARGEC